MSTIASDVYDIPQEHKDFRDLVRQLAVEQVAPRAAEIDRTDEYPWDLRRLLADNDILALPYAEEWGGTGTGTMMLQMAVEELAKASASRRADADGPGAGVAADRAVRLRGAEGAVPAQVRDR